MTESIQQDHWKNLERLIEQADPKAIEAFLSELPIGETARTLARLDEEMRARLLAAISPIKGADLVEELPSVQAVEIIDDLEPETAAEIIGELPSDEQADILGDLDVDAAAAILDEMEPAAASDARVLTQFADDVAGGLMATEFVAIPRNLTVSKVIEHIRAKADTISDLVVQYLYVTDRAQRLVGVLPLRSLLLFDRHQFLGVAVTDQEGRLVGVVHQAAVEEALGERSESDFRRAQGIVSEELRIMPLLVRSRRRMAWLSINIVLNVIAASVIAFYEETLAAVIALAVFLPIISDMSGCSGNQAVAVSMRELALGLVKPTEAWRVWGKEILVGAINGVGLGLLIAAAAWVWKGNPYLGLVVGSAMALNTIIAVSLGGTLPLFLKGLGVDPALASGPILTTVTDMCGFFLILSLAALMLPLLV
jgi:magnesium transporter